MKIPKLKSSDEVEFPFFSVNKRSDYTALPGKAGKVYIWNHRLQAEVGTLFSGIGVTGLSWQDETILYSTTSTILE